MKQHGYSGKLPGQSVTQCRALKPTPVSRRSQIRVDHAYILVGTDQVLAALQDCASAGVKVVSVLADGFAEAGPEDRSVRQTSRARAERWYLFDRPKLNWHS